MFFWGEACVIRCYEVFPRTCTRGELTVQRFRCWEYTHWIKISNISHRHKNRFTTESHPKVTVLTIVIFFPKRRKRGLWRVTNKFRGDWNLSWLDIHLNHRALLSAGCSQIKRKKHQWKKLPSDHTNHKCRVMRFCSWGRGMRIWKTSGFKDKI